MAQHGMVVTSQPLAAQAGLRTLMQGGNAIDAAVATAAVLSLVEPMSVGVASDLFAIIYVAKDRKIYVLNASGTAATGATINASTSSATNGIQLIGGPLPACPSTEFCQ